MTRLILTGATGFIGRNLVDLLHNDYTFELLVRETSEVSSLRNLLGKENIHFFESTKQFDKDKYDVLIHSAGLVHDPSASLNEHSESNRDLTLKIAEQAIDARISKFIYLSSASIFGDNTSLIKDTTEPSPNNHYGNSKLQAEQGLEKLFQIQQNSSCVILRLPMVYGCGNKGNILRFLRMASKKIKLPLKSTKYSRNFLYVGNLADALKQVIKSNENKGFEVYNFTDGTEYTSGALYNAIYQEMHAKEGTFHFPISLLKLMGKIGTLFEYAGLRMFINRGMVNKLTEPCIIKSTKFNETYNWSPPFKSGDGLVETVNWYTKRL